MTNKEREILVALCDRVYFGEAIGVDDIDTLASLYAEVKTLIGYKPNKKRFAESLIGTEKETLDIEMLNFINRKNGYGESKI